MPGLMSERLGDVVRGQDAQMRAVPLPLIPPELLSQPGAELRTVAVNVVTLLHEYDVRPGFPDHRQRLLRAIGDVIGAVEDVPREHSKDVGLHFVDAPRVAGRRRGTSDEPSHANQRGGENADRSPRRMVDGEHDEISLKSSLTQRRPESSWPLFQSKVSTELAPCSDCPHALAGLPPSATSSLASSLAW